jgi:hypothetical protein
MAQFAGSRSLDERRRRRLATESDEAHAETPTTPLPRRVSAVKSPAKSRGPGHFPLRKVISARLWKHSAIGLGGSLLAGGIVLGGWAAQVHSDRLGPGFAWLFDLSAAHLVRWYVSTAIFLTSQLALLIWWLRSQSLQDFKGGYRGWAGCAAIGLFAAFAIQTNALRAWTETAHWLWHIDGKRQSLSWLGPVALCPDRLAVSLSGNARLPGESRAPVAGRPVGRRIIGADGRGPVSDPCVVAQDDAVWTRDVCRPLPVHELPVASAACNLRHRGTACGTACLVRRPLAALSRSSGKQQPGDSCNEACEGSRCQGIAAPSPETRRCVA